MSECPHLTFWSTLIEVIYPTILSLEVEKEDIYIFLNDIGALSEIRMLLLLVFGGIGAHSRVCPC
jgi:hypothetical protein